MLMYAAIMAARSVQISLDEGLLREIDRRKETRARGRSAFIRSAIELYLEIDRRRAIDRAYASGYGGTADEVYEEFRDLMARQHWPAK